MTTQPRVTGRNCRCCGTPVRIMCETDYCGERCRNGKCNHPVGELSRIVASKREELQPIWDRMVNGDSGRSQ